MIPPWQEKRWRWVTGQASAISEPHGAVSTLSDLYWLTHHLLGPGRLVVLEITQPGVLRFRTTRQDRERLSAGETGFRSLTQLWEYDDLEEPSLLEAAVSRRYDRCCHR